MIILLITIILIISGMWLVFAPTFQTSAHDRREITSPEVEEEYESLPSEIDIGSIGESIQEPIINKIKDSCISIIDNGPGNEKVDIVFVPDNYMSEEELFSGQILSFRTRVEKFIDYNSIYGGLFSKEPFKSNKNLFNVHILNISEDKNCQIPGENGGDQYGCMLWAKEKATLCQDIDTIIVLSNDLSGTGGQSGYAFTGQNFAQITPFSTGREEAMNRPDLYIDPWIKTFVHEFGHSFGNLKDEYYTNDDYGDVSGFTNCDSFGCPKWCNGITALPEPQYEECSKINNQNDCENSNLIPACIWTQLYGEYVCRGTFSYENFGANCLEGYGCYQGCEGLSGYRSMLECNIMGGKCTGNEEQTSLEFGPRAKDVLEEKIYSLSSAAQ